jgi:hypothetical protein
MNTANKYWKRFLTASAATLLLAANSGWAQSSTATGSSPSTTGNKPVATPRVAIVPASQPDPMLNNGCWVQLMDNIDKPKQREYLTIVGTKYMPALETASGKNWAGRADGISIGPNALARIYAGHAYGGASAVLRSNRIVQDLRADLGLVDSISSMQIECRNS